MNEAAAAMVLLAVFGWGLWSARLGRADLTAPILFVSAGLLLSTGPMPDPETTREVVRLLAEITLVWVLFADASRVGLPEFRADLGLFARLLGIGLPLTIAVGTLLAAVFFGELGFWLALLIGAALAPTDAALGAAVMSDPSVPERIRRTLNVESGLNDGIATPVVTLAIAGAAATAGSPHAAIGELAIGVAVGIGAGLVGGRAMRTARARGWASEDFAGPGVLALALAVYTGTHWLGGNGFVAAFVAGIVFGAAAGRGSVREVFYVEQTAGLASLLTWLIFGAAAVPIVIAHTDWPVIGYALLSLTVIRMLPAGLSLIGSGLPLRTIAFISWFGPRGLASIVFAMLAVEDLGPRADRAVAMIGLTVLFSVFAHGLTAKPLAARFTKHSGPPATAATGATATAAAAPGGFLSPAVDDTAEAGTTEDSPRAAARPPGAAPEPARATAGPPAGPPTGPPGSGEDATAPPGPEHAGSDRPAGVLPARGLLHRHPAHHRPDGP
ncbi:sodium:proton antiporter [Actinoplanes capillaceus]|uniref:Sodium:proton antiporter n=1 Tax=Actinoplanes campanulatus TaxID=113559 RepID=A0ABQ3WIB9_9ACTN|nr:cation:proton antiporter [Actinoplanes capillaceus]GID45986.1 sodium:proton antiporter [Actinoplanes capillaceus]